jgi:exodeoxyribonuclease VII large subunit
MLERERRRIEHAHERLARAATLSVEWKRAALEATAGKLLALSPQATLDRGYAIVRTDAGIVTSYREVSTGARVDVTLAEGGFAARVEDVR